MLLAIARRIGGEGAQRSQSPRLRAPSRAWRQIAASSIFDHAIGLGAGGREVTSQKSRAYIASYAALAAVSLS